MITSQDSALRKGLVFRNHTLVGINLERNILYTHKMLKSLNNTQTYFFKNKNYLIFLYFISLIIINNIKEKYREIEINLDSLLQLPPLTPSSAARINLHDPSPQSLKASSISTAHKATPDTPFFTASSACKNNIFMYFFWLASRSSFTVLLEEGGPISGTQGPCPRELLVLTFPITEESCPNLDPTYKN